MERLDAGDGRLLRGADSDDLDLRVERERSTVDLAGDDGSTTGDREDVLDRHEEGLVEVADGVRDVLVDSFHQVLDGLDPLSVALESLEARDAHDRGVVAVEALSGEELTHLHLDELEDLFVLDHVGLVQRDQQVGDTNLAGEQNVLTGLSHRAVGRRDHEDRTVHLSSTGDHVLDVVSVTGSVDVRVVALARLVLDVRDVDRDTALLLFRCLVDLVELELRVHVRELVVQHLGDRRRQRRLAVVNVTDGSDVDVRFGPLELGLRHWGPPGTWVVVPNDADTSSFQRCICGACGSLQVDGGDTTVRPVGTHSPRVFLMISSATFRGTSE